jgi:gamma-glutamyltranspeptidase/glutathione hydrolase
VVLANPGGRGFDVWDDPRVTLVERHAPDAWIDGLQRRGHEVVVRDGYSTGFGHAHAIAVSADGLAGASDPRALSDAAVGW